MVVVDIRVIFCKVCSYSVNTFLNLHGMSVWGVLQMYFLECKYRYLKIILTEVKVSIYMLMYPCKHKVGVLIQGMRRTYKAIHRVVSRAGYMGPVLWGSESCLFSLYHLMEWKSPQLAWFTAHLNRREPWQEAKALIGLSRGRARTAGRVVTGLSYRAAERSWGEKELLEGLSRGWAINLREGHGWWERTAGGVVTGLSDRAAGSSWGWERAAGRVVMELSYTDLRSGMSRYIL